MGTKRKIKKTLQKINKDRPCTKKETDRVIKVFHSQLINMVKVISYFLTINLPNAINEMVIAMKEYNDKEKQNAERQ